MSNDNKQGNGKNEFPKWDEANPRKWLDDAFRWAEEQARAFIEWYDRNRQPKRRGSRVLRALAIAFSAGGALLPLIDATGSFDGYALGKWGYVFLAIAAACVAVDKFFGLSTGWVRYIRTEMALESALKYFEIDWAELDASGAGQKRKQKKDEEEKSQKDDKAYVQQHIDLLKKFLRTACALVEKETEQWAEEFHHRWAELEKLTEAQSTRTAKT